MEALIQILAALGLFFFFSAGMGLIRFPDFYSRMHAAGKGDTLSSFLLLLALGLYHIYGHEDVAHALVDTKIFLVMLFILFTSPTSTHVLMQAGRHAGVESEGDAIRRLQKRKAYKASKKHAPKPKHT